MDRRVGGLHVESMGQGPSLVLLHGWAMHAGLFEPMLPALAARHRVHAVDLPGHGGSEPLRPWTLDGVVGALQSCFAGEPGPLAVIGWSLGAALAMRWALEQASRIDRLALVAATPKFVADDSWSHGVSRTTLERFSQELAAGWKPTLQRFLSLQVQGSDEGRATLASLRLQLFARGAPDLGAIDEALAAMQALDLRNRVRELTQRSLVISGERDTLVPAAAGRWLAEALPAGEWFAIAGAGHAPFLSHREAFMAPLTEFLQRG